MAKKKAKDIRAVRNLTVGLQAGTDRTIYAVWDPPEKTKNMKDYQVVWEYYTNQNVWFSGNPSNTSATNETYSAPSNAVSGGVRVTVTPISKTYKKKKKTLSYFTAQPTTVVYKGGYGGQEAKKAATPSNIDIEISGLAITAKVTNYADANSNGKIHFQIVKNDGNLVAEGTSESKVGVASFRYDKGEYGTRYKARAYAERANTNCQNSDWSSYTANKSTSPKQPTAPSLSAASSDSVTVKWSAVDSADSYKVGYTSVVNDTTPVWDSASGAQEQSDIRSTYFFATSLTTGKRWYFRLKAVNSDGVEGAWSGVASIVLGTRPDKPTIWSYTTVGKVGTAITLNWVHNSEDGSEQSGYKINYVINDLASYTETNTSNANSYSFSTSNLHDGDKVKWRISTRGTQGITNEWSEWSEYREFVVYSPPSVTFSVGVADPSEILPVIKQFPIHIPVTATPATQTPVAFYLSMIALQQYDVSGADGIEIHVSAGQEIYSKYLPTSSRTPSFDISPGDVYLDAGIAYQVTISVAMTNGLTAETTHDFLAKWDDPEWDPYADVLIDPETLTAMVHPYCMDEWGFEHKDGISLAIYRIDFDGGLTEIASGIDPDDNVTVCDLHPSLDYARYRIVATDLKTGVVFFADLPGEPVGENSAVIQWEGETRSIEASIDDLMDTGVNWSGTILKLPYNIDVSDDISPDVSLVEYIGRKHPVSYYGTQQGSTSRWSAEIPKNDTETIAKIRALAIYPADVYVREPYGTGYWANVKVSYNITHNKAAVAATFTITRVEGGA